jgi:uncharacterized membrane protein
MKLHIVPSSGGFEWVRLGIRTFFRQPLAMAGLFFMFMAVVAVLSMLPVIGLPLSLAVSPVATAGMMAAAREASEGRFPMPANLVIAFRSGQRCARDTLILGAIYALALLLVFGLASLVGAPDTATEVLADAEVTPEVVQAALFRPGLWLAMLLSAPVLMAFWHAPALVLWHGVSPIKSLFFSLAAVWANRGAMLMFGLAWMGVIMLGSLLISLVGALLGGAQAFGVMLYPAVLLMASMFQTSVFFTYRDSFSDAVPPLTTRPPGDAS